MWNVILDSPFCHFTFFDGMFKFTVFQIFGGSFALLLPQLSYIAQDTVWQYPVNKPELNFSCVCVGPYISSNTVRRTLQALFSTKWYLQSRFSNIIFSWFLNCTRNTWFDIMWYLRYQKICHRAWQNWPIIQNTANSFRGIKLFNFEDNYL